MDGDEGEEDSVQHSSKDSEEECSRSNNDEDDIGSSADDDDDNRRRFGIGRYNMQYEDDDEEEEGNHAAADDDDNDDFNNDPSENEWREKMYYDRDCSNNISRSLRVESIQDLQLVPGRDGYAYFFTSLAEGPMLSPMALQQILVLLHVIHSFIPEECILETDLLKPTFDKNGGLEKLVEHIPISDDEWRQLKNRKKQISKMLLCDIPRYVLDILFAL